MKTYEYMLTDLANYKEFAHERRQEGWRLMRICVPEIGVGKDWKLIFERDSCNVASATSVAFGHGR